MPAGLGSRQAVGAGLREQRMKQKTWSIHKPLKIVAGEKGAHRAPGEEAGSEEDLTVCEPLNTLSSGAGVAEMAKSVRGARHHLQLGKSKSKPRDINVTCTRVAVILNNERQLTGRMWRN